VYVLTATKSNVNIALTYKYMSSVIELFKAYFGNVNEDSLRSNFVLIYELLDGAPAPATDRARRSPLVS
jgi:AP-2 complex subunit mu-1